MGTAEAAAASGSWAARGAAAAPLYPARNGAVGRPARSPPLAPAGPPGWGARSTCTVPPGFWFPTAEAATLSSRSPEFQGPPRDALIGWGRCPRSANLRGRGRGLGAGLQRALRPFPRPVPTARARARAPRGAGGAGGGERGRGRARGTRRSAGAPARRRPPAPEPQPRAGTERALSASGWRSGSEGAGLEAEAGDGEQARCTPGTEGSRRPGATRSEAGTCGPPCRGTGSLGSRRPRRCSRVPRPLPARRIGL